MYLHKHALNIQASTAGGTAVFSTVLSGCVYALRYEASTSVPLSTKRKMNLAVETSARMIFTSLVPSSDRYFFPRTVGHGTSGNALDSTIFRLQFPLVRERAKLNVTACSSIGSNAGVLTLYLSGN